jgi:hypothetical protein
MAGRAGRHTLAFVTPDPGPAELRKSIPHVTCLIERLDLDEPPDRLPGRVAAGFEKALGRGLSGLWTSHSPVGPDTDTYERALAIETAWERQFKDRLWSRSALT